MSLKSRHVLFFCFHLPAEGYRHSPGTDSIPLRDGVYSVVGGLDSAEAQKVGGRRTVPIPVCEM